jgi:molybdopterin/thiamine biosynthesis adenylyltransferase
MSKKLKDELKSIRSDDKIYHKNVIYISPKQQEKIKKTRILFAGVGLGSVIAEAAMRLGFEDFVFIDGDDVELSNLNRQNYHQQDIGKPKVKAIKKHLQSINPNVKIKTHNLFLDPTKGIAQYLKGCDIAINAIDFDDNQTPFEFDRVCKKKGIPVIHPFNFGWAGAAYLITPNSPQIYDVPRNDGRFELILIDSFINYFKKRKDLDLTWFEDFLATYTKYSPLITPPQLAVGSYMTSAIVTDILYSLVNGLSVKTFPNPYFLSAR